MQCICNFDTTKLSDSYFTDISTWFDYYTLHVKMSYWRLYKLEYFRPHRMHSVNMRPIATDGVAWSVCLCVSVCHVRESCKNGWTDRDADRRIYSGGSMQVTNGSGNLGGCPTHLKALGVSATAIYATKINNGDRGTAGGPAAMLGIALHCSREKSAPCDAAFHQNSLTTCCYCCFCFIVTCWCFLP